MLQAGAIAPSLPLKDGAVENGRVLLFFFKISCPVCQLISPFIERLSRSTKMRVLGISQDNTASTNAFKLRFALSFPVLLDESKAGYPLSNQFGISSVPCLFQVEENGTISLAFSGFSKADLEALGQGAGIDVFKPDEQVPLFRAG